MEQCELVQGCFFTMDFSNNMPSQVAIIKRRYCNHDFEGCARYILAKSLDVDKVPHDLDPTDIDAVHQLINLVAV